MQGKEIKGKLDDGPLKAFPYPFPLISYLCGFGRLAQLASRVRP